MLNGEQGEHGSNLSQVPFTYADYLRVPELLALQSTLSSPEIHDEMFFIIVQQVQELWFKQILYDLRAAVSYLTLNRVLDAVHLLGRANRILKVLGQEVAVMETLPPQEFLKFRNVLVSSSGFESEQFRELEYASGLAGETFLTFLEKHMDLPRLQASWPVTLHEAFLRLLEPINTDPAAAATIVYMHASEHPELYLLAETLSEYEVVFTEWRFHHVKLVERTIGARSPGTAGSAGVGYLGKTLGYRFFPELWEARNRIAASGH